MWTTAAEFEDIRYETAGTGSPRSRSTAPRSATPSARRRSWRSRRRWSSPARTRTVGAIILTGEGPLAFCSGGDQRVRGDTGYVPEGAKVGRFHVTDLHVQMRRLPKPIIAMVAGYAVGGGQILHLVCDLSIAADNARFGQTGPRVGLLRRRLRRRAAGQDGRAAQGEGDLVPVPPVRRAAGARDGARQHRRAARAARGGDRRLVPRDARPLPLLAAAAEGVTSTPPRTGWPGSSSSPTTRTSSSTPPRRPPRAARRSRPSGSPTSPSSRGGREHRRGRRASERAAHLADGRAAADAARRGGPGARRHLAGRHPGHVQAADVRRRDARRAVHPGRHEPLQRLLRRAPRRRHRGPARAGARDRRRAGAAASRC